MFSTVLFPMNEGPRAPMSQSCPVTAVPTTAGLPANLRGLLVSALLAWGCFHNRMPAMGRLLAGFVPPARLRRWGFAALALAGGWHSVSGATAPSLSSATDVQVQVNTPFSYRITINQAWALNVFDASPLPPGLSVNKRFGFISGKPTQIGTNSITLIASQDSLPDRTLSGILVLRVTSGQAPPLFKSDPTNVVAIVGEPVVLSAEAIGTGSIQYQWYRGNMIFGMFFEGPTVDGATDPQLVIPSASPADVGWYVVKASNAAGTTTSQPAELLLIVPPEVYSQPGDTTVHEGMPLGLYVGADGGAELSIQWRKDGIPVPNATNQSFNVLATARSDAGTYDAVLDNAAGHAVSDPALVTVVDPLRPQMHRSDQGAPILGFDAIPGIYYTIFYSESLDADWNYLTDVLATGTNVTRTVDSGRPHRFFRVGPN